MLDVMGLVRVTMVSMACSGCQLLAPPTLLTLRSVSFELMSVRTAFQPQKQFISR